MVILEEQLEFVWERDDAKLSWVLVHFNFKVGHCEVVLQAQGEQTKIFLEPNFVDEEIGLRKQPFEVIDAYFQYQVEAVSLKVDDDFAVVQVVEIVAVLFDYLQHLIQD